MAKTSDRRVAISTLAGYVVSTVLLLFRHRDEPYETMVFPGDSRGVKDWRALYERTYRTRAEAQAGHNDIVLSIENGTFQPHE